MLKTNSPATCHPASCSDLQQALLALRDLARAVPAPADPQTLSALQQARLVLRRHGMLDRPGSAGTAPTDA